MNDLTKEYINKLSEKSTLGYNRKLPNDWIHLNNDKLICVSQYDLYYGDTNWYVDFLDVTGSLDGITYRKC